MSKTNTYIWDGKNNEVVKVLQLVLPFSPQEPEIDSSYMESFGIPLKDGAWLEMSYWMYDKPTSWFDKLEPMENIKECAMDGYDLEEEEEE